VLKLSHTCLEELSKFNSECSSFETWLTAAEHKVEASRGRISKPETLEQREAAHEVLNSSFFQWCIWLVLLELCCCILYVPADQRSYSTLGPVSA